MPLLWPCMLFFLHLPPCFKLSLVGALSQPRNPPRVRRQLQPPLQIRHLMHRLMLYHLGKLMLTVHWRKRKSVDVKSSARGRSVLARKRRRRGGCRCPNASHPTPRDTLVMIMATVEAGPCRRRRPVQGRGRGHHHHY